MGPGREPQQVKEHERSQSGYQVNKVGRERLVFPTFTSYPLSRAFRPGKPGSIFDANAQKWDEPNAEEREAAMCYVLCVMRPPAL